MTFKFERLEVWELSLKYIDTIYRLADDLPSSEKYIYSMGDTARFEVEVAGKGKLVLAYKFTHGGAKGFDRGSAASLDDSF